VLYKILTYLGLSLLITVTSACQPLERSFQPSQKASLRTAPGPRASLYVAAVQNGAPDMDKNLAEKLQDLGIAAFTGDPVPNRYSVTSSVFLKDAASFITWSILDPSGRPTGLSTIQEIGPIIDGPPVFKRKTDQLFLKSASEIDIMLGGSGINFATLKAPTVFVPIVKGAPGDGAESLAAAMQEQILKYDLEVPSDPWKASYILQGTVILTAPKRGSQIITILWKLERQNGEYVGKVEQKNRIRVGTLNGSWGPVAIAAARGGARGILKLLRQVESRYFQQKK